MMEWLAFIPLILMLLVMVGLIGSIAPVQYDPLSPDEEYRWLTQDCGLSHEAAEEVMDMGQERELAPRDKRQEAQALADELIGSCASLPDHALDDLELCQELDTLAWLCEDCGWWVEVSETNEDGQCQQCQEHEDEWCR